jgi:hypothetical protein
MSMGESLVNYPIGTLRIRLEVIRGGWNDGTGPGLYHTTATSGSDTVLIDLKLSEGRECGPGMDGAELLMAMLCLGTQNIN